MSLSPSITDPIASEIGHGAPGLRDGLRTFGELVLASASQKHVFAQVKPARYISSWANDTTAGVYLCLFKETHAGILRDVVGVRTLSETLVRAETLALCRSTAGTYYWDPEQTDTGRRWDDGTLWDAGLVWDGVPVLYVHLTGNASPRNTETVAQLGFYYGSHSIVQPTFGPEKTAGGSWASTAVGAGGGSASATTNGGTISGSINAAGGRGVAQAGMVAVAGAWYRVSGTYQTDAAFAPGLEARLRVGIVGAYVELGGRTAAAGATGLTLAPTYGQERRFSFDFIWPAADTAVLEVLAMIWNPSGGALTAIGCTFGALSCRRIWRWERYESRLTLESVPASEQRRADSFFGPVARGSGTLTLANGNGHFEAPFASLDWINQDIRVLVGGRFVDGGNESPLEDTWPHVAGVVTAQPSIDDMALRLPFEDLRVALATQLPPNVYDDAEFPYLLETDRGRRRPLLFGNGAGAVPACIDSRGYGVWEALDVSDAPNGYSSAADFWSYLDGDAAARKDTTKRAQLTATFDALARATLTQCPMVVEVTPDNHAFELDIGGGTLTCSIAPGVYLIGTTSGTGDAGTLLGLLRASINAVTGDALTTTTFDPTTYKVTIARPAGTFKILTSTGPWKHVGMYGLLGFQATADYTGALSYTAETPMFTSVKDVNLRVHTLTGFKDDAAGTYTGTPAALIEYPADILRCLLVRWAHVDPAAIDATSFNSGHGVAFAWSPNSVYLGIPGQEAEELSAVVERIENSHGVELVLEGDRFYWGGSGGASISLVERDYLEFEGGYEAEDVYRIVRVGYAQDVASGEYATTQTTTRRTLAQFGRADQRTFQTTLSAAVADPLSPGLADPYRRKARFVTLATTKRRRFRVRVKGSLLRAALGTTVTLTRAKGLSSSGALAALPVRLLGKTDDAASFETTADLIEVV